MAIIVKTSEEVKRMRNAGKVVASVFERLKDIIKPGVSTLDVDKATAELIKSGGGVSALYRYRGFPRYACVSVNEELLHGIGVASRRLTGGDIVTVDITVCVDGYHADAARTFLVGDVSDDIKRLVDANKQAFFNAVKFARHGAHLHEICKAIETTAKENGFAVPKEYCGHGIGADIHEDPSIPCYKPPGRGPRLSRNMCLAIEPMFSSGGPDMYIRPDKWTVATSDESICAHYENTVLITDGEPEILTL